MSEFRLAFPLVLLLFFVPVGFYLLPVWRRYQQRTTPAMRYSDTRLFSGLKANWRIRLLLLPNVLRWVGWGLLVIALARPQGGNEIDVIRGQGIDIVLALDISTSMASLDFKPLNRLETAKSVIGNFISGREFDRIGLVVFARSAFHQAPLTLDYAILQQLLDGVQLASQLRAVDGRRLDGTAIGLGLASSANMLRAGDAPSQVVILLTDGANNAGLDPNQAAAALAALDIRVYTIGMGVTGLVDTPTAEGEIITIESDLNEEALQAIASQTDGLYFRAEDTEALQAIYDRINSLEQSDAERVRVVRWQDYAPPVIGLALSMIILERLLRRSIFQVVP